MDTKECMKLLCKKCGAELPDDTTTCPFCNAKLADEPPAEEAKEEVQEETAAENLEAQQEEAAPEQAVYDENELKRREQIKRMMDEKQQQLNEIQERREIKRKKQKRNRILACILIAIIAAAAIGGTIYLVKNGGLPSNNITATASPSPAASPDASALPSASPEASPGTSPSVVPMETQEPEENWNATGGSSSSGSGSSSGSSSSGSGSSSSGSTSGRSSSSGSSTSGGSSSSGTSSSGRGSSSGSSGSGSSSGGSSSSSGSSSSGSTSSSSGTSYGSGSAGSSSSSNDVSYTGVTNAGINSQLAVGGEVVYDSSLGYLMSFNIGNTRYYAYVSEGSTTAQIQNQYMTIQATPTSSTYRGNTVYDISSLTMYKGEYILPYSGTRLLTQSDISSMSKERLALARNEIYARHGRRFQTEEYQRYFESCSWYKINPNYNYNDDNSNLNEIEEKNVAFLLAAEHNM